MKILYLSRARIPSRKAHVTQIHKMCDAFQQQGTRVELLYPSRVNRFTTSSSTDDFYQLRNDLVYKKLFCLDLPYLDRVSTALWFWVTAVTYAVSATLYILLGTTDSRDHRVIYGRDRVTLFLVLLIKPLIQDPIYFELHDFPSSFRGRWKWVWKRLDGLIAINQLLKEDLVQEGFPESTIQVEHDGVDLRQFESDESPVRLREKLKLPPDKTLIGYTGHLYSWKGTELILDLAETMPDQRFVTVGGLPEDVRDTRDRARERGATNLLVIEHQPQEMIPKFLRCFDILLLPTTGETPRSKRYTSPLKLFEYMAAEKPIVASKLESLSEILTHDHNALLAHPGDPEAFKRQILRLRNRPDLSESISRRARKDVLEFTWDKRARRILDFIRDREAG